MRFSTGFATLAAVGLSTAVPTAPTASTSALPGGDATYIVKSLQMYAFDQRAKPSFQVSFHFSIDSPRPEQAIGDGFCSVNLRSDKLQNINWMTCTSEDSIFFKFQESEDGESWVFTPAHFWGGQYLDLANHRIPKTLFKVVDDPRPRWHHTEYTGPLNFNISKSFNPSFTLDPKEIEGGLIDIDSLLANAEV